MSFPVANNCSVRRFDCEGHLYLKRFIPDEDLCGRNVVCCSICYVKAHHRNSAILLLHINAYNTLHEIVLITRSPKYDAFIFFRKELTEF